MPITKHNLLNRDKGWNNHKIRFYQTHCDTF